MQQLTKALGAGGPTGKPLRAHALQLLQLLLQLSPAMRAACTIHVRETEQRQTGDRQRDRERIGGEKRENRETESGRERETESENRERARQREIQAE